MGNNSVYQKLKLAQKDVAAVLHNVTRYAAAKLYADVENIVIKVYSHFNSSATRTAQLQEFCEFVESDESCILLRHVTRWLSLLPALDHILKFWEALKSDFCSLGEDECLAILWKCFGENRITSDISEIYFLFLSHALKIFPDTIEILEAKSFTIISASSLMAELKEKLERRLRDQIFGLQLSPNSISLRQM